LAPSVMDGSIGVYGIVITVAVAVAVERRM
jgi:hypothetical protein